MKLFIESVSPDSVWDFTKSGYVEEYLPTTKVGKVSGQEYKKFDKKRDSEIIYMTADEYIKRCSDVFGVSVKDTINSARNPKNIDIYAEKMLSGEKFPVCYIDYVYRQQEGRHRALAFKKAFGENAKMPVLVITEAEATMQEIYDYCLKRFGERFADSYFGDYAYRFGYNDKQIDRFLGIDSDDEDYEQSDNDYNEPELDDLDNLSWDDLDIDDEVEF
jgi:hypothetical protein